MQFFVQDIREWGNKKLFSYFAQTAEEESVFLERLHLQSILLAECKSTAFSVPRVYATLYDKLKTRYYGMDAFMLNCEPMVMTMDTPPKSVQRRFKNQWDACWACFGKSVALQPETVHMLADLGVRMCFAPGFSSLPDELFVFYNTVLKWFVYTSTEGAIMETGLSPTQLIEHLIMRRADLFVHDIQVGF